MEMNGSQNSLEALPQQWRHAIEKLIEEKVEERIKAFEEQYSEVLSKAKTTPIGIKKPTKVANDSQKSKKEEKKGEDDD